MLILTLEESVDKKSFVRAVDLFVDAIDMKSFGFTHAESRQEGRPAFHPGELMKLYLYGYRYGIRSSRRLQWFLHKLPLGQIANQNFPE